MLEETKTFNEALRAYAIQYKERLRALHKSKPLRVGYWKEFKGRDKELTTGILTNIRLARLIEEEQSPHSTRGKKLEDRYKGTIKLQLLFGPRKTQKNTTTYKLRVTLENDIVVGWKNLE